jgi:hypothetical protein
MINSEQKLKELSAILEKKNYKLIIQTISILREEIPFVGAISLLISLYDRSENITVRKTIEGFMNDIRDPSAREEVISVLRKKWKNETIRMLVSSCWQSGMNYSEYYLDIVNVFLSGDYATAVECFTVIEESLHDLNRQEKKEIAKLMKDNAAVQHDEKLPLQLELISLVSK